MFLVYVMCSIKVLSDNEIKTYIGRLVYQGRKAVRCSTQLDFLNKSLEQQSLPNGIIAQMKFTPSLPDNELKSECNSIMYDAGSRILDSMIIFYRNRQENLRSSYYTKLKKLRDEISMAQCTKILDAVNNKLHKEKLSCIARHNVKLERDNTSNKHYIPKEESKLQVPTCNNLYKTKKRRRKTKNRKKPKRVIKSRHNRSKVKGILPKVSDMTMQTMSKTVINLTDYELSPAELYVFYLSQSFAPTLPLPNLSIFEKDLDNWISKLRYRNLFQSGAFQQQRSKPSEDVLQLQKKMSINKHTKPAFATKCHALELFLKQVCEDARSHNSTYKYKSPDNLPQEVRQALKKLQNLYKSHKIVIRPFDKGVGWFLLHEDDYIARTLEHLSDTTKYKIIEDVHSAAVLVQQAITQWTETFNQEPGMTDVVIENVIPDIEKRSPGNIYLNIKAHKPPPYPGRMITTGCNSYIENLSAITAVELKKVKVPYVIADKLEFLRKLDQINASGRLIGKKIIHVTIDVVNMFPNIPREFGLEECYKHLNKRQEPHLLSTACIIEALKITLDNNLAMFNGNCYLQLTGTAMGPKNACDYADIAMNYIDQAVHNNNPDTPHNPDQPEDWSRFRDDIYTPWIGTIEQLSRFGIWLNSIHKSLKFIIKYSTCGMEFIELYVYSDANNILRTKLYSKPSDTFSYLVPSSCHKTHIIENIPRNIARRVYLNNSETDNYLKDKVVFMNHLVARGYNKHFVKESFADVEKLDRINLYSVKPEGLNKNTKVCLPLVIDTNPALPDMSKIINKHKYLLDIDSNLAKIIPSSSVFVSHRSAKTIKDLLISSKLPKRPAGLNIRDINLNLNSASDINNTQHLETALSNTIKPRLAFGTISCNKCYLCKHFLQVCDEFSSFHTQQIFKHKSILTCKTKNVIYLCECMTHEKSYTGYTINGMTSRFSINKCHFKAKNASCEFVKHLIDDAHTDIDFSNRKKYDETLCKHVRVTLIEEVRVNPEDSIAEREAKCEIREGYWQTQLRTLHIYGGLNKRDNRRYVSKKQQEKENVIN